MGKWDYDEYSVDADSYSDGKNVDVRRALAVSGQTLDKIPMLQEALEQMFDGIRYVDMIEGSFNVERNSLRSKPKWDIELEISGARRMTSKEKEQFVQGEAEERGRQDKLDLRNLRQIKERAPHLFEQV